METIVKQKILMVDDRPENILALEHILEQPDRELVKAYSGKEALKCILNDEYALILLDVQMPEMDGFETAALIRGREKSKHIPIIFVTAISKEEKNVFKGYEAGAVDFLHKPLNPDILESKVKIFLELDRQRKVLEHQNQQLITARKNTDDIFINIEEGLFLLDNNLKIQPQYSVALEKILSQDKLAGNSFLAILKDNISDKKYENTIDYLDLMFKEHIKEVDIKELNPLIDVEYLHRNRGSAEKKYLLFHFKRVKKNDRIDGLMATVLDNTDQILLKRKLKEAEESSMRQAKLMHVFQLEPQLLKEFLLQTEKEIILIKTETEKMQAGATNIEPLETVYRLVHSIKGNANLLNLESFAQTAHSFEDFLTRLSEQPKIDASEKNKIKSNVYKIQDNLEEINSLIARVRLFYKDFDEQKGGPGDLLIGAIEDLINRLNKELNKNVELDFKGFNSNHINTKDFLSIKDILVQLIRNSMFHGVEEQEERAERQKSKKAIITLSSNIADTLLSLKIKDDGRGIPIEKLKEKAIASGKWKEEEIKKWGKEKLSNLIFVSGISSTENTNMTAGRGIGMQIIKQKVEELNGTISFTFEAGKFTEFLLELPVEKSKNV